MSRTIYFGMPAQPNLAAISKKLEGPMADCNSHFFREYKISFKGKPKLALTVDKPYTARATVGVFHQRQKVGNLNIILFSSGDGTGNQSAYKLDKESRYVARRVGNKSPIHIPSEYRDTYHKHSESILPRDKLDEQVLAELFLPLASFENEHYHENVVSLELLTVGYHAKKRVLRKDFDLGESPQLYQSHIRA